MTFNFLILISIRSKFFVRSTSSPLTWTLVLRSENNPLIQGIGLGLTSVQVFGIGPGPVSRPLVNSDPILSIRGLFSAPLLCGQI